MTLDTPVNVLVAQAVHPQDVFQTTHKRDNAAIKEEYYVQGIVAKKHMYAVEMEKLVIHVAYQAVGKIVF